MNTLIQKTAPNSFFVKFHKNSKMADELFCHNPKYENRPVTVKQVMMITGDHLLAEIFFS